MGARVTGTTGTVALAIGIVLLVGCGADDGTDMVLDEPTDIGAISRCEALARGELPDDVDADTALEDLIARERERCLELDIVVPAVGFGTGSSGAGADGGDDGAGSAADADGDLGSDGGAQDDSSSQDEGDADDSDDLGDPSEGVDRTLMELARVYCDIRTEVESYPTQPPGPVEDRLEAQSLELFAALEAIGSGLADPAFQAEAHQICPEWVPDPTL